MGNRKMFYHKKLACINQTRYSRVASTAETGQDVIFTQNPED